MVPVVVDQAWLDSDGKLLTEASVRYVWFTGVERPLSSPDKYKLLRASLTVSTYANGNGSSGFSGSGLNSSPLPRENPRLKIELILV